MAEFVKYKPLLDEKPSDPSPAPSRRPASSLKRPAIAILRPRHRRDQTAAELRSKAVSAKKSADLRAGACEPPDPLYILHLGQHGKTQRRGVRGARQWRPPGRVEWSMFNLYGVARRSGGAAPTSAGWRSQYISYGPVLQGETPDHGLRASSDRHARRRRFWRRYQEPQGGGAVHRARPPQRIPRIRKEDPEGLNSSSQIRSLKNSAPLFMQVARAIPPNGRMGGKRSCCKVTCASITCGQDPETAGASARPNPWGSACCREARLAAVRCRA